ncbi:zinc metalloproteinase nas-13 [Daphnia magna]|uniref:zinc metalloproteinase nas-13 n=1 Tax=Daphnia magna TaxID=35525 RepID=UPI0014025122|nr:zinc metalloproteinase nas-13 [Daphnia magna]
MFALATFCFVVCCTSPFLTWAKPLESQTSALQHISESTYPDSNFDLFEGDIAGINGFDVLAGQEPKNAIVYENLLWPNGVVYYSIADNFTTTELDIITQAINEYETKTCIRFVERSDQLDYVYIEKTGAGCYSYIGRIGVAQTVSLDSGCFNDGLPGTAIHELMHALGFFHEQSRTDRDDYIIINYPNIQPGTEANFLSYGPDVIQYLGASYDYGSVMHYGAYSFPIDPSIPTIITRQPGVEIGQRKGFSEVDIFKLNALYKCNPAQE